MPEVRGISTFEDAGISSQRVSEWRDPLPEPVMCTPRWARNFMAIVSNETLIQVAANGNSSSLLPADVHLLAALAAIDAPGLAVAFSEGWITPFTRKNLGGAAKFYVHNASRPSLTPST